MTSGDKLSGGLAMLRFLLDKFKQAPGPFKQTRLIVGDLAEEMVDLADYYIHRKKYSQWNTSTDHAPNDPGTGAGTSWGEALPSIPDSREAGEQNESPPSSGPKRALDVSPAFAAALDNNQNTRKQVFKVLAVLVDAESRGKGPLTAKEVSEHGAKLGISIRHENVRKVIRMRLDKHVEIRSEQVGNRSIYKYRISPSGIDFFKNTYL